MFYILPIHGAIDNCHTQHQDRLQLLLSTQPERNYGEPISISLILRIVRAQYAVARMLGVLNRLEENMITLTRATKTEYDSQPMSALQRPTLVLNRNWQPINIATVASALLMLWNDTAWIVDPIDYRLI